MALVYSTETGRVKQKDQPQGSSNSGDGIVRIQRQTKGRKGKGVCIITGLDMDAMQLKLLASELKKLCGCGGAIKDGTIEIQGDDRQKLQDYLTKQGYQVKLAGG